MKLKMGRGRASASCNSSSSTESSSRVRKDLSTDLSLGLGLSHQDDPSISRDHEQSDWRTIKPAMRRAMETDEDESNSATFYVKVYMEGIPIGRKLDLLAHDGYHDLIQTLDHMFNTSIIWSEMEMEGGHSEKCHVLTYEDREGDWMMVGDVPWQMFLSTVTRLKITRV